MKLVFNSFLRELPVMMFASLENGMHINYLIRVSCYNRKSFPTWISIQKILRILEAKELVFSIRVGRVRKFYLTRKGKRAQRELRNILKNLNIKLKIKISL